MKVYQLLLTALLGCQLLGVNAQSNTFPASGNVGIGTTSPQAVFEVRYVNGQNLYRASDPTGQYRWRVDQLYDQYLTSASGNDIVKIGQSVSWFNSGNVGIGTTTPSEKLSVNGNIRAREIKVETTNWPDYVFEVGYNLEELAQLEKFIKANRHLPGVPSAKEIEESGVSLGEMNALLLKKVEELTLHLIEKDKQLKNVIQRIEALEKTVN